MGSIRADSDTNATLTFWKGRTLDRDHDWFLSRHRGVHLRIHVHVQCSLSWAWIPGCATPTSETSDIDAFVAKISIPPSVSSPFLTPWSLVTQEGEGRTPPLPPLPRRLSCGQGQGGTDPWRFAGGEGRGGRIGPPGSNPKPYPRVPAQGEGRVLPGDPTCPTHIRHDAIDPDVSMDASIDRLWTEREGKDEQKGCQAKDKERTGGGRRMEDEVVLHVETRPRRRRRSKRIPT